MTHHVGLTAEPESTATELGAASHVFVVGLPRTGTHLMRDILKASTRIDFGPESRFMGGRRRFGVYSRRGLVSVFPAGDGALSVAQARELLADTFSPTSSGPGRNVYWQRLALKQDPAAFTEDFLKSPRRAKDLYDLALTAHAQGLIPGDKSPDNLFHIDQLFEWFPRARVIHMIRDPRAIYASMLRKGWVGPPRLHLRNTRSLRVAIGAVTAFEFSRAWRQAVALDAENTRTNSHRYLRCRFEDLLVDPESNVQRISDLVGVSYLPEMIDRSVITSSYMPLGTPGFRQEAIDAWRDHLDRPLSLLISRLAGEDLTAEGYPRT